MKTLKFKGLYRFIVAVAVILSWSSIVLQASSETVVEDALAKDTTYEIMGTFGKYDFADAKSAFDWAFTTNAGMSYQLQGIPSSDNDVFGWKVVDIESPIPAWYMFKLNGDVDGDGSEKFDWVMASADINNKMLYKLAGVSSTGNFEYSSQLNVDYTLNGTIVEIQSAGSSSSNMELQAVADAYAYAYSYRNWDQANLGAYDQLKAGWHPVGGESRAFMKFDFSSVEDATKIKKAVLRLFQFSNAGGNGVDLGVYNVTSNWLEGSDTYHSGEVEEIAASGELSWIQQPSIGVREAVFNPGNKTAEWVDVDITPMVMKWLTSAANNGLVIKSEGTLSGSVGVSVYHFASRERNVNLDVPEGKYKGPMILLYTDNDVSSSSSQSSSSSSTSVSSSSSQSSSSVATVPEDVGKLKWTFNTVGKYSGGDPAVAPDGTIYISANGDQVHWKRATINAINPNGTLKWESGDLDHIAASSPTIGSDGTIYTIGYFKLYAIDPIDGSFKWIWEVPHIDNNHYQIGNLAIGNDGTLFLSHGGTGSYVRKVFAVTPQGQTKWIADHDDGNQATHLTIGKNGKLFAYWPDFNRKTGVQFENIVAIDPGAGSSLWETELPNISTVRGIAIDNDGNVIVSYDARLTKVEASSGSILWSKEAISGVPSIAPNGDILIFGFNEGLHCYDAFGDLRWKAGNALSGINGITIDSEGKIYVVGSGFEGNFQCFDTEGNLSWAITLEALGLSPAISNDGTIYIVGSGDKLFAVQGDKPLATRGWPRHHYKNSNSRNAGY